MSPRELYVLLLVWFVCILLLLPCGFWRSSYTRHSSFWYLLKCIKLVSWCYHIFIANISIVKQELVLVCGFGCLRCIPGKAQTYLCRDDSEIGGHSPERGICLTIQCTINPFFIPEDVVYPCFSIICVSVGPEFFLSFLKFSIKALLIHFLVWSPLGVPHFCKTSCAGWICCLHSYLFGHSCLHEWLECCGSECHEQGRIAR